MKYAVLYMLATAFAGIVIHFYAVELPKEIILLFATLSAIIVFNLLNAKNNKVVYKVFLSNDRVLLYKINLFVVLSCIGLFLMQLFYLPSRVLLCSFALLSLLGAVGHIYRVHSKSIMIYISTFLLLLFNIYIFWNHFDSTKKLYSISFIVGIFVCSLSTYLLAFYSQRAMLRNHKVLDILSIRYWLMLIVSITATCLHHELHYLLNFRIIVFGFLLGCLAYVIPMFFFQKAIQKIGNEKNSMLIGATPFIMVVVQSLFIKDTQVDLDFAMSVLLFIIILAPAALSTANIFYKR